MISLAVASIDRGPASEVIYHLWEGSRTLFMIRFELFVHLKGFHFFSAIGFLALNVFLIGYMLLDHGGPSFELVKIDFIETSCWRLFSLWAFFPNLLEK